MRITKKNVQQMFFTFCKTTKQELSLDHNACYGGYIIEKIDEIGGVTHPYGCVRMTAKEMHHTLYMMTRFYEEIMK